MQRMLLMLISAKLRGPEIDLASDFSSYRQRERGGGMDIAQSECGREEGYHLVE